MSSSTPQLLQSQFHNADTYQWRTFLRQALVDLRVSAPAIVQSFDPLTQTVTAQIAISEFCKPPFVDGNGVTQTASPGWVAINPIHNVPVILPRAGGFCLTFPLKAGDEGLLVFCDSCIDLWWQQGGQQPPPGGPIIQNSFERRRHDLTDCGFIPMLGNQTRVLPNYSTESVQLRSDDGTTYIELKLGVANILSRGGLNITGPVNIVGDLNVQGRITATQEIAGKGIPLSTHGHPVLTAPGETGPPQP
jgi:Phage protein Gp138 N-terminal domain